MRNRGRWLEVATLLGAIAPFLPFIEFFGDLSLVDCLLDGIPPDAAVLLVPPAFLPVFILVWLWRCRRSSVPTTPTWPVVTRLLAVAAMLTSAVGTLGMQGAASEFSGLGLTAAFFLPMLVNLGLWWRNHRRQLPLDAASEVLLLGTYSSTTLPWTLAFLAEGAMIGAWLIAAVGVAYLATIVMRLRGARMIETSSP
jgi:hypothetical protein